MLNLSHFEKLAHRLVIKDRSHGHHKRFTFNPSQKKIIEQMYIRKESKKPLWMIFLKARRLGVSTFAEALLVTQQLQKKACQGMIVAQVVSTAKSGFQQAKDFADCLPMRLPPATQSEIYFPHSGKMGVLRRATAKTVIGGRGLTLNGLHMTEAAFYPGEDSFVALLSTVSSKDLDNIVIIETTANGIEGPGEAYYNYWNDAVAGHNDFMPIFLPWYDDPDSYLPDDSAPDAPDGDYEKWLMKEFKVTQGQIGWHRLTMATKCGGSIHKWRAEYPSTPEEAFISTGEPAFDFKEMKMVTDLVKKPIAHQKWHGIDMKGGGYFENSHDGPLKIWEHPIEGDHYFIGADAAKGVEDGDYAAAVCWNAETGEQAFRYAAQVSPQYLAIMLNWLGRHYNNAMINIELTGGWGWAAMKELRDYWHYPNQYLWMSKDDRPDRKPRQAYGWETTENSRRRLLTVFRLSLLRGETFPRDAELAQQMSTVTEGMEWRWKVRRGHDDIFMAAMIGWISIADHHYPHKGANRSGNTLNKLEGETLPKMDWIESPETTAMGVIGMTSNRISRRIRAGIPKSPSLHRLEGI